MYFQHTHIPFFCFFALQTNWAAGRICLSQKPYYVLRVFSVFPAPIFLGVLYEMKLFQMPGPKMNPLHIFEIPKKCKKKK